MNRHLPCGCHWLAGRAYVCAEADAHQRGILAAEATGNALLTTQAYAALIAHWQSQGLTRREFDLLATRSDALLRRDEGAHVPGEQP